MPASTCWQWRATRAGGPAGERLGHGGRHGGGVVPGGVEEGGGGLEGHEGFGQPVADRLEGAMGRPNWIALERVHARQLEHRPRRSDELVSQGRADPGPPRRPSRPAGPWSAAGVEFTGDLEQAERGIEAGTGRDSGPHVTTANAEVSAAVAATRRGPCRSAQRLGAQRHRSHDRRVGATRAARTAAARGRTTAAGSSSSSTERGGQQPVERGRGTLRRALAFEEDRDGAGAVGAQRVVPTEVVERGIECRTARRSRRRRRMPSSKSSSSAASISGRPRGRGAGGR